MKLLCRLFGHQPPIYSPKGWWSPGEQYGRIVVGRTDGIGRIHAEVQCRCARCGEKFIAARVHLPKVRTAMSAQQEGA
ncbi:hypothetical protein [Chitiniphilus shinanonensis]|uniref:hypothetical protein n=1 Tax=Chitiniphilus shinanonensis TaxID=553088 RepID=UPI003059384E